MGLQADHTYGGMGVAKRAVELSEHAVIHIEGQQSLVSPDEPRIEKMPLVVRPGQSQLISRWSRCRD